MRDLVRIRGLVATALPALLLGCGVTSPELSELDRNQALWNSLRPSSYGYTVRRDCFCTPDAVGPVRVVVDGTTVTSRTYVSGGDVPARWQDLFPTVDGLFDAIRDAIDRDAFSINVDYDVLTGIPNELWIDYDEFIADEEVGFTVVEDVSTP